MVEIDGSVFTNSTHGLDAIADTIGDIRFTNKDSDTLLDYEIEKYDKTSNQLIVWVEIPTLDGDAETTIYMYYDNAETSGFGNEEDPVGVWDSNFVGVWHMNATSGMVDSTGSGHDVSNVDGDPTVTTGMGGDGIDFDGNDAFDIADHDDFDGDAFTVEIWMLTATTSNVPISNWNTDNSASGFGEQAGTWYSGGGWTGVSAERQTSGWHYYVVTHETAGVMESWRNEDTSAIATSGSFTKNNANSDIGIAKDARTDVSYIDADIDEVRISNIARSDEWRITTYNTISDPASFYTATVEEGDAATTHEIDVSESVEGSDSHAFVFTREIIVTESVEGADSHVIGSISTYNISVSEIVNGTDSHVIIVPSDISISVSETVEGSDSGMLELIESFRPSGKYIWINLSPATNNTLGGVYAIVCPTDEFVSGLFENGTLICEALP